MNDDVDKLGDEIKGYEKAYDHTLPANEPVIVRLDGHSFHNFTASMDFQTPFDESFKCMMYDAATAVLRFCGSSIAYIQSDEITILMMNGANERSTPFFNNRVQKLCSLLASVCSVALNRDIEMASSHSNETPNTLLNGAAYFDCRCFTVPRDRVVDVFEWRQRDAIKNAINSIIYWKEREMMSGKRVQRNLDGIPTSEKERILREKYNISISDYPVHFIRGACIVKKTKTVPVETVQSPEIISKFGREGTMVERRFLTVDYSIPLFHDDPMYIQKHLRVKNE